MSRWSGSVETMLRLHERGANMEAINRDDFTAVTGCAHFGKVDMIRQLGMLGANLHFQSPPRGNILESRDIVQHAEHNGHIDCATWLKRVLHFPPLFFAAEARRPAELIKLCMQGADCLYTVNGTRLVDVASTSEGACALPLCAATIRAAKLACKPWSPATHALYPPKTREFIRHALFTLLQARRTLPPLSFELILHTLSFTRRFN